MVGCFLIGWDSNQCKCNSPVDCCSRRLDGEKPIFSALRKMQIESLILCQKTPDHIRGWVFFNRLGFEPMYMQQSGGLLLAAARRSETYIFRSAENANRIPHPLPKNPRPHKRSGVILNLHELPSRQSGR